MRKEIHYVNFHDRLIDSEDPEEEEGEGIDIEETRYYGPNSYNDNLDLVGYSADWRDRNTGKHIAVIDFIEDGEGKIRYCPHCEEYGFKHKLGAKIRRKGEARAVDDDQFLSCYECGNTFGRFEIEIEKTLKVDIENHIEENPFESKKSIILAIPKRTSKEGRRISERKRRKRYSGHDEDSEIDEEIRRHGEENVHIIQDR